MNHHRARTGLGLLIGGLAILILAAGCTRQKAVRISVVLPATGTEFGGELRAGAEAAARDIGKGVLVKIVGPAQIDPSEEIKLFQNEAATVPNAIVVGPIPPALFGEPALQAQKSGIKVAWVMSPPPPEVTEGLFVGQREYDMGQTIGNRIADEVEAKHGKDATGTIIIGNCVPGMTNLEDRLLGARRALSARLPKATIPPTITDGNERAASFAIWQQAVAAHPDGLAFVPACETGMVNLAKIKEDDKRDFALAVWDTPDQVRASIAKGTISAAAPPSHFLSAYLAVWTVAQALQNKQPVPQGWMKMPIMIVDKTNIAAFGKASAPPSGLQDYFKGPLEKFKAAPSAALPPMSAARP